MKVPSNIGLVLSGGGFRGFAHIGAIKAIEEFGIFPNFISGTSAGAIVGALYSAGNSVSQIKDFFDNTPVFKLNRFTRKKPGFLDSEKYYDDLINYFKDNSFENLERKLFVSATDLVEGKVTVFSTGELIKPILASAAFPGVFSPVMINDCLYSDGGILDNFPIAPILNKCDMIIGIDVSPIRKPKITDFKHAHNVMQRAYYLRAMPNSETKFGKCDIMIQPKKISNHGVFSTSNLDQVFEIGYLEAKKQIETYFENQKLY
ncbi:patatin-like phospholipase family protein [Aquimarina litoralis]|uniref:patatin-like phospholipase family protein n=1 Tax=Aquimarina litoralis TaxID=584605 RepID=UPI001C58C852|nr:patatin-like phospholipase family protein [Aquimarina litoralis]MBW1294202.1 patatin [Aquimarina litoralis]